MQLSVPPPCVRISARVVLLCLSLAITACAMLPNSWTRRNTFTSRDLKSEDPVLKIRAIQYLSSQNDRSAIPELISLLRDDDPTIRDQAYVALQNLTAGKKLPPGTPEFRAYDPPKLRNEAVAAWEQSYGIEPTRAPTEKP